MTGLFSACQSRLTASPHIHHQSPVGASLLAIAVCQSTSIPTDLAPSRASSLPQGSTGGYVLPLPLIT
ncbi:hypothetical protein C1C98_20060 [Pseudomonas ogarae]|uniref:Uncharacterized protein n=1 Tax=Pseudomonas ogarae (strain DSM 112162 / CECT 30235 / F113) TaxID=1114970 RepID=A0ABN5G8F1_PSEO1|nr:hypothetical protein C1C98_20060 [Pseudomonas ogarae]